MKKFYFFSFNLFKRLLVNNFLMPNTIKDVIAKNLIAKKNIANAFKQEWNALRVANVRDVRIAIILMRDAMSLMKILIITIIIINFIYLRWMVYQIIMIWVIKKLN